MITGDTAYLKVKVGVNLGGFVKGKEKAEI